MTLAETNEMFESRAMSRYINDKAKGSPMPADLTS